MTASFCKGSRNYNPFLRLPAQLQPDQLGSSARVPEPWLQLQAAEDKQETLSPFLEFDVGCNHLDEVDLDN